MDSNKDRVILESVAALHDIERDAIWQGSNTPPSREILAEIVQLIFEVIFPEYLMECSEEMTQHRVAINLEKIYSLLSDQIERAMHFNKLAECQSIESISEDFISSIAQIKKLLTTDVEAMYKADPAATSYAEVVLCYPSIVAMTHHRVAHSLHQLEVPIIPRVIAEIAHSKCGIDIHPGAQIGSHFAIDHGTGVVIGETTIIGSNVVVYQGVTLGAKGFRFDADGNVINIPRHPIIDDNVRIYSNSSILGRITIGHDSIIGGNMWIDRDIAPHSKLVKKLSCAEGDS
ncbi:MAG: serine acetyltransferase [Rikenellaceae bacterium]